MAKFKVLEGSWKGQIGEFVRHEFDVADAQAEKVVGVVVRMAAGRLVEFKPEHVEPVADEPAAEPVSE